MRFFAGWVLLCAQVLAAPAAVAQEARTFTPASAWALDYGDDYCRLMRDFKNGDDTIGLFLERTSPGPVVRPILLGDAVKLYRGAKEIGYHMHPSGAPRMTPTLRFRTTDGQQYLNLGPTTFADPVAPTPNAPPRPPARYDRGDEVRLAAGISGIAVDSGVTAPVVIETGPLGDAVQALQGCVDDLVASWGLDAEAHKSLSRPAMPAKNTAGWIARDTIAFGDFSKLSGGNNEIRVIIDKEGHGRSCAIQWPALDAKVNDRICEAVMANGAFLPALDASGQPIDSYWYSSVFFLMPPFGS